MRDEALKYDYEVLLQIRMVEKKFPNATNEFLYYHNEICPGCQQRLKIQNGFVKNIGAVGTDHYKDKVAIYAVCKKCIKEEKQGPSFKRTEKSKRIIESIKQALPHHYDEDFEEIQSFSDNLSNTFKEELELHREDLAEIHKNLHKDHNSNR